MKNLITFLLLSIVLMVTGVSNAFTYEIDKDEVKTEIMEKRIVGIVGTSAAINRIADTVSDDITLIVIDNCVSASGSDTVDNVRQLMVDYDYLDKQEYSSKEELEFMEEYNLIRKEQASYWSHKKINIKSPKHLDKYRRLRTTQHRLQSSRC